MKAAFLQALETHVYVTRSCKTAGIARSTAYQWRSEDPAFAEAWKDVDKANVERLEAEAERRGREGVLKPVFYQGEEVGQVREYSDALLMFMLKAKDPERYRDRSTVTHAGDPAAPVQVEHSVNLRALEEHEVEELHRLVEKARPVGADDMQ